MEQKCYSRSKTVDDFSANTHLFLVLPPGGVQRLNECSRMPHKHGKAGGTHDHAEDSEPHVSHADRRVQAIPDTQHVTHGLEQGVGVLLTPGVILKGMQRRRDNAYGYLRPAAQEIFDLLDFYTGCLS